jgi:hypothetical protein
MSLTAEEITASLYAALEAEFPPTREPGWISRDEYAEHVGITSRGAADRLNKMVAFKGWEKLLVFDPAAGRPVCVYRRKLDKV